MKKVKDKGEAKMKVHISLNVKDINDSVEFYSKMLSAEPVKFFKEERKSHSAVSGEMKEENAKTNSGYAKFDIQNPPLNLVLNEVGFAAGGSLSHLGLQVESTDDVLGFKKRWEETGLFTVDEMEVDCCYAKQDKTWVRDPDGNEWEAFVVLEDLEGSEATNACDCSNKVEQYVDAAGKESSDSCCDPTFVEISTNIPKHETCCLSN